MANQRPASVSVFLARLPADRRREVRRVRTLIRRHLPRGYEEVVSRNTLIYQVPLTQYAETYNHKPLWYVALSAQKSYLSLHLMSIYGDAKQTQRLKSAFQAAGKRLDMGKACIHFKTAADLPQDVIGAIVASMPVQRWIAIARSAG